jgi:hypothetical protein
MTEWHDDGYFVWGGGGNHKAKLVWIVVNESYGKPH